MSAEVEVIPMDVDLIRAVTDLLRVAKGTEAELTAVRIVQMTASPAIFVHGDAS